MRCKKITHKKKTADLHNNETEYMTAWGYNFPLNRLILQNKFSAAWPKMLLYQIAALYDLSSLFLL